jgi:hypothetical protein
MRFAQLARKLKVSQEELTKYLKKKHNIEVLEGPNTKIEDYIVDQAKTDYNYVSVIELKKMEIQEAASKVEKQLENVNEDVKVIEDALVDTEETVSISIDAQDKQKQVEVLDEVIANIENNPIEKKSTVESNEEVESTEEEIVEPVDISEEAQEVLDRLDPEDGVIKSPKVEVEGIKVMGKIELPEVKVEEPEVESEEDKQERLRIEVEKEQAKIAKILKKQEEDKKRREKKEAKEQKIRREREKKKKKAYYEQNHAAKHTQAPKAKKKKKEVDVFEVKQKEAKQKEYSNSVFGKFLKWLNGE